MTYIKLQIWIIRFHSLRNAWLLCSIDIWCRCSMTSITVSQFARIRGWFPVEWLYLRLLPTGLITCTSWCKMILVLFCWKFAIKSDLKSSANELTFCNARHGTAITDRNTAKQPGIAHRVKTNNFYLRFYICVIWYKVLNTMYNLSSIFTLIFF